MERSYSSQSFTNHRKKHTSRKIDADKAKGIDLCYLCERPRSALDAELCVAELAVAGVGRRQPLLQAALVHRAQSACAVARRQEALAAASFVANTADGAITETDNTYYSIFFKRKSEQDILYPLMTSSLTTWVSRTFVRSWVWALRRASVHLWRWPGWRRAPGTRRRPPPPRSSTGRCCSHSRTENQAGGSSPPSSWLQWPPRWGREGVKGEEAKVNSGRSYSTGCKQMFSTNREREREREDYWIHMQLSTLK